MMLTVKSAVFRHFAIGIILVILSGISAGEDMESNCPDYCDGNLCLDLSHRFNCCQPLTGDCEVICISDFGTGSNMEITVDACAQNSGEYGQAWAMLRDEGTCSYEDCQEPNEIVDCLGDFFYTAVIRVTGDQKTFSSLFSGVAFYRLGEDSSSVNVTKANCYYTINTNRPLYVQCLPKPLGGEHPAGASFGYTVSWYGRRESDGGTCPELDYDFWKPFKTVTGTITVKVNPRNDFDPFNFRPAISDGSGIAWLDRIDRIYVDPNKRDWEGNPVYENCWFYGKPMQPEWHWTYHWYAFEFEDCFDWEVWMGEWSSYPDAEQFQRTKVPAWREDVGGAEDMFPGYMAAAGWSAYYDNKYIKLELGLLGDFYYHCNKPSTDPNKPNLFYLSSAEYCTAEQAPGEGTILWRCIYDSNSDQLKYVVKINTPASIFTDDESNYYGSFTPTSNNTYYMYDWEGSGVDLSFYHQDTQIPLQTWSAVFDEDGRVVESSSGGGGCTSCSGGGDYERVEYYDGVTEGDSRYEGLVKKHYNAEGDIVEWNEYTLTFDGMSTDPNDSDYVYLGAPLLVSRRAVKDPGGAGEEVVKIQDWQYDGEKLTAVAYTWVTNTQARVTKYRYENNSFTTVVARTEYELLNDNPDNPVGATYTTYYEYYTLNGEAYYVTTSPSGARRDVRVYDGNHRLVWSYVYDVVNDALGQQEFYDYDTYGYPDTYEDAYGGISDYHYTPTGFMDTLLEPYNDVGVDVPERRLKTIYTQDGSLRLTSEEVFDCDPYGGNGQRLRKTIYGYNTTPGDINWGRLESQTTYYDWQSSQYQSSEAVQYVYDPLGRVVRTLSADGRVNGSNYDSNGRLAREFVITGTYDPNTPDAQLTLISQTRYHYDENGRLWKIERAKDDEPFTYDAPQAWITTQYDYDFLGRKTKTTEDVGGLGLETVYDYNNQGELYKTTQPHGAWAEVVYDGRGKQKETIAGHGALPEAITEYEYDSKGNLILKRYPEGETEHFIYDHLGRLVSTRRGS